MEIVNIHQAKFHLSRLLQGVAEGRPFIIVKAGKPIARVTAIDAPEPAQIRLLGFLAGQFKVPDDFDRMGQEEILAQFGLDERICCWIRTCLSSLPRCMKVYLVLHLN